ncbi:MAG TPA: VWA domain-containing protein [Thermoanaerobaculia bacterium]|nr:VWA domain-containing protein [Thermoanaerobaculia bacterium]
MRPRIHSGAVFPLTLALVVSGLAASKLESQRQRFQDTTTVTLVEVPVQVTVKGEPVRGLTQSDFEIFEGRKKQDIVAFEVVDLSALSAANASGSAPEIPLAGRRHFLVFFDLSLSNPASVTRSREAAADLVLEALHATDMVAVATYSQNRGPQLVLGFTTDRNQVRQAIETLGLVQPREIVRDPLGLVIGDLDGVASGSGSGGARGDFDPSAELQAQLSATTVMREAAQRGENVSQIARLMDGIGAIGQLLQNVEGRKHVLFLSEGFEGELLFGTESIEEIQRAARAVEDGQTWNVDNAARFGDSEARRVVDRALVGLRQSNTTLQAVDIGGLVAGGSVTSRGRAGKNTKLDTLQYMAGQTGGELFANYNDLGDSMKNVLKRTSVTYLLAFQPSDVEPDGRYREIRVRLVGGPRGADVVHRPGYFPPKPLDQQSPFEQRLQIADRIAGGQAGGSVAAGVLAAGFPVTGAKAYVPVLIEASGKDLQRGHQDPSLPIEIYAYAMDADGAVRDFFVRNMALDRQAVGPALDAAGFKYWGHFDLDPGEYTVRVMVRNPKTGAHALEVVTVEVPGGASKATLLPPLFADDPSRWVLAREDESEQRVGVEFPFMQAGNPFIPAARPEVRSGASTPLTLVGYNFGAGSLSASGHLFSASGDVVDGGQIELVADASGSDGKAEVPAVFSTGRLAPGDYVLVVTLRNTANQREETSSLPIRVVG